MNIYKQVGFTLVELMIALALGLVISAAAIMLFLTGSRSQALQQGQASLQDDANFGLSYGLTAGTAPQWTGVSNVNDFSSDQLTIQYLPEYIIDQDGDWYGGFDCEGNELKFTPAQGRRIIVQRYFLRADTNNSINEPNQPLSLVCDAGHYPLDGNPASITGFGGAGEVILKRADHFRVLYAIQAGNNHRYVDTATYLALNPRPRILAVQIGILVRSNQSVGNDSMFSDEQVFQVLDQAVTVRTPAGNPPKYVRQVVAQTIALRNTFGERGQ